MKVIIYTDGAAKGNPGPGGLGIVLMFGKHRKEMNAAYRHTTNNRMELLAVILALEALTKPKQEVEIYTDSQYVKNAVSKGWVFGWQKKGFKGKANADLWRRFLKIYPAHTVEFHWVKGHAGIPENERCDQLANEAIAKGKFKVDAVFEAEKGVGNKLV